MHGIVLTSAPSFPYIKSIQLKALNEYLHVYDSIQDKGGWKRVDSGKKLVVDDVDQRVKQVKQRLSVTGEYAARRLNDTFDLELLHALKIFQEKHGITACGELDAQTVLELNVPVEQRIKQINTNIDRWFRIPTDSLQQYILVNVAYCNLAVVESDSLFMNMKVIVGKITRKTPLLNSEIKTIKFNPHWIIPPGILRKDIFPEISKDPAYLSKQKIKVYKDGKELNIDTIRWTHVSADPRNYTFIQDPGLKNPLGKILFTFPNPYMVYMHDTPDRRLFNFYPRTFSSGCIRLENANDLASYLLKKHKSPQHLNLDSLVVTETVVKLEMSVPVNLLVTYFTAFIDSRNQLYFVKDFYKKDN